MLRSFCLVRRLATLILMSMCTSTASAELIVVQGFETSGDTWGFTSDPAAYNTAGSETPSGGNDVWDDIQQFSSVVMTPNEGTYFWGMQDLDNPTAGNDVDHILTFNSIDVSGFSDVEVGISYNALGYGSTHYLQYELVYDGVGQEEMDLDLSGGNTMGWVDVTFAVPDNVDSVGLVLIAYQNGGAGYAGWDSVTLSGDAGVTGTPEPSTLMMIALLVLGTGWVVVQSRIRRPVEAAVA